MQRFAMSVTAFCVYLWQRRFFYIAGVNNGGETPGVEPATTTQGWLIPNKLDRIDPRFEP